MAWMRSRWAVLGAAATVTGALVLLATLNPWSASAQSSKCADIPTSIQLPIANCTFVNLAVHPVNDIHITYQGLVFRLSSDPNSLCRQRVRLSFATGFTTTYDCRFLGPGRSFASIPSFGDFEMLVFYLQPNGPNIVDWYWTQNGTPVTITPTGTNTPTSTDTPSPANTATNTPDPDGPTATSTPTATATSTPDID
jgi:hypothetical protein